MCTEVNSRLSRMEKRADTREFNEFDAMAYRQKKSVPVIPNPEVPDEYGYSSGWE